MSGIILPPWFILPPIILPPGNGLMIYNIYPCPIFCPLIIFPISFLPPPPPPGFILPPLILPPWKWFIDLHYLPMFHINFTLYTRVPYHFTPLIHFATYNFSPYHFAPWKWFNDLHYLPMSHIILLLFIFSLLFCPLVLFCPLSFCPPPWKWFIDLHYLPMSHINFVLYTYVPYHFAPLIHFAPYHFPPIILPLETV